MDLLALDGRTVRGGWRAQRAGGVRKAREPCATRRRAMRTWRTGQAGSRRVFRRCTGAAPDRPPVPASRAQTPRRPAGPGIAGRGKVLAGRAICPKHLFRLRAPRPPPCCRTPGSHPGSAAAWKRRHGGRLGKSSGCAPKWSSSRPLRSGGREHERMQAGTARRRAFRSASAFPHPAPPSCSPPSAAHRCMAPRQCPATTPGLSCRSGRDRARSGLRSYSRGAPLLACLGAGCVLARPLLLLAVATAAWYQPQPQPDL
jgi:hypothetical protein